MFKSGLKVTVLSIALFAAVQFILPYTSVVTDRIFYSQSQNRTDESSQIATRYTDSAVVEHSEYISKWNETFGVNFTTNPGYSSNANYSWNVVSKSSHDSQIAYYQSFDYEISKYSTDFLDDAGLSRVIFVDKIQMNNGQAVLGFADVITGELFLNIDAARAQTGLIQSTVHHEIAHILFYTVYRSSMYALEGWPAAGASAAEATSSSSMGQSFPSAGFVSSYSKTSVAEDIAEVFAYIMTDSYNTDLRATIAEDDVLKQKVEIVRSTANQINSEFILPI